jgi:uncharacterized membrane protein YeaQ/YmgE (transglycosylase-associated protein family)
MSVVTATGFAATELAFCDGTAVCSVKFLLYWRNSQMHMSGERLLVILFVGILAGWLAAQIVEGTGLGLIGDLIIGIVGAFIGDRLLPQLGIHLGFGIVAAIINATVGAVLLLLILRLVRGGGRRWGRRW